MLHSAPCVKICGRAYLLICENQLHPGGAIRFSRYPLDTIEGNRCWFISWIKRRVHSALRQNCSPSPGCRQASGAARAPRMQSSDCTRNSSEGSRRRPCCRRRTPLPCCSGRCWPPARSTCTRSMVGRRSPQSPSVSQLTSQLDTISSCYRKLHHA